MTDPTLLIAFIVASLVLAATPGPAVMYVVARTLAQGRRAGLASVAGVALGNLGNAIGASLGLAALFALSAAAFTVVKLAGAAYLVWLGIQALRSRPAPDAAPGATFQAPVLGRIFRDGFWVALLNPKTAIFFAAFLPQFIDHASSTALQSVVYGALFVAIAGCTDTIYVFAAGLAAPALHAARSSHGFGRHIGRWATGAVFIGLGVFTACTGQRSGK